MAIQPKKLPLILAGTIRRFTVTLGICNGYSDTQKVTEYPAPTANITPSGDTLTANLSSSYQWSLNGVIIPGATIANVHRNFAGELYRNDNRHSWLHGIRDIFIYHLKAETAQLCLDSFALVTVNVPITAVVNLEDSIYLPVDSVVFDLQYDPTALYLVTVTSPDCQQETTYTVSSAIARITLWQCNTAHARHALHGNIPAVGKLQRHDVHASHSGQHSILSAYRRHHRNRLHNAIDNTARVQHPRRHLHRDRNVALAELSQSLRRHDDDSRNPLQERRNRRAIARLQHARRARGGLDEPTHPQRRHHIRGGRIERGSVLLCAENGRGKMDEGDVRGEVNK